MDEITTGPIADYKPYALKVGMSRTTLFKCVHRDPSKRRTAKVEGDKAGRGKGRLLNDVRGLGAQGQGRRVSCEEDAPPYGGTAVAHFVYEANS